MRYVSEQPKICAGRTAIRCGSAPAGGGDPGVDGGRGSSLCERTAIAGWSGAGDKTTHSATFPRASSREPGECAVFGEMGATPVRRDCGRVLRCGGANAARLGPSGTHTRCSQWNGGSWICRAKFRERARTASRDYRADRTRKRPTGTSSRGSTRFGGAVCGVRRAAVRGSQILR